MPEQPEHPKFYTVNEVASILRLHPVTVRKWIIAGTLPSVKLGRKRLIPAAKVREIEERV